MLKIFTQNSSFVLQEDTHQQSFEKEEITLKEYEDNMKDDRKILHNLSYSKPKGVKKYYCILFCSISRTLFTNKKVEIDLFIYFKFTRNITKNLLQSLKQHEQNIF